MISRKIKISFQKEGIHCYPAAKDISGVEFLAHPHRHIFHFYVTIEVNHNDRDIEFILFKRELEAIYDASIIEVDYKSCEMLAEELLEYVIHNYPRRDVSVEVYEDNENGAIVEYRKEKDNNV